MDEPSQARIWQYLQREESQSIFRAAHPRHDALLRTIRRLRPPAGAAVLNIGVGDGHFERQAQAAGFASHALDPDPAAIGRLEQSGIQAKTGSITGIPYADATFDFVVATEVLEHLTAPERGAGLSEIHRVLKPGGYLLGSVPFAEDLQLNVAVCPQCSHVFHRWGHTTSFDLPSLRAELQRHFAVQTCRTTAFVEYRGRSLAGKAKALVRLMLARCGAAVAYPSILFLCQKRGHSGSVENIH